MKISPTPWHVAQHGRTIHEASGICIAEAFMRGTETPSPEDNACLMAAAPDLVQLLKKIGAKLTEECILHESHPIVKACNDPLGTIAELTRTAKSLRPR